MPRNGTTPLPDGFAYRPDFLTEAEERVTAAALAALPFRPFEFHGHLGKRRVAFYGWRYEFGAGGLQRADPMPAFLLPVRDRAAAFAGLPPAALEHALLTEYPPGAPIGWHRDKAVFGDVVGISLLSPCVLRFRRRRAAGWDRASLVAEPRSAYLLRGPARTEWEHSIPPVADLRYSITFRTLREPGAGRPRR